MISLASVSETRPAALGAADVIQEALVAIRNHLGMEVAYFSEFVDGRSVFRRVDAPGLDHLIKVGDSQSLDDVYCNHILEGRLPELIPDTSKVPLARAMPITDAVPIGSHVSIPIRLADGTPYGMFCCLSPRPMPTLNERDLATMKVFASLAAKQVNGTLEERRDAQQTQARIGSVLAEGGYEIVFQPIFDFLTSTVCSCEALCRFAPAPYRSPDKWFNEAFAVGLGVELELAVAAAAIECFPDLPDGITLSVNVSPHTLADPRLGDVLDPRYADRTIVEVTEHAKVADYAELLLSLAALKRRGVALAIDDAGAGYSGLQHILQLAPDYIKMDMSLTRSLDADPARRALASALVFYAGETGSCVVAEGIETPSELATLKRLGVHRGQGYLLGKPGPIAALGPGGAPPLRRSA